MNRPTSSSREPRFWAKQSPLDIPTYAATKQQLADVGVDFDLLLRPVVNVCGYVQLEHSLDNNPRTTRNRFRESLEAASPSDIQSDELTTMLKAMTLHASIKERDMSPSDQMVYRQKVEALFPGRSYTAMRDDFRNESAALLQRTTELYANLKQYLCKYSELATEGVKFVVEYPTNHELQCLLVQIQINATIDVIIRINTFFMRQHAPCVSLRRLLSRDAEAQLFDVVDGLAAQLKRINVLDALFERHAQRLSGVDHPSMAWSLPLPLDRLSGHAEIAYEMARHKLASVQMDINDLVENKMVVYSALPSICSRYMKQLHYHIQRFIDPFIPAIDALKQKWVDALQVDPTMTPDHMSSLVHHFFPSRGILDAIVSYMVILFRGYAALVEKDLERFTELVELINRHRTSLLIHHETEYSLLWSMQTVWKTRVTHFLACFQSDITPDASIRSCLTSQTRQTLDQFFADYTNSWSRCKVIRKRGMNIYQRILDDREHAELMRERASKLQAQAPLIPMPVSYPKSASSISTSTPHRRAKKEKTRRPAQLAEASVSSSSSNTELGEESDSDAQNEQPQQRVDKKMTLVALRDYYHQQYPDWKHNRVRVAAKKEWWAEQLRQEERNREIESMRQRIGNLSNVDELPSFHTLPPSTPHPRSFAAMSSVPQSAVTSSTSKIQVRHGKTMSLDQFWQWQKEEVNKRRAEHKAKQRQHK